MVKERRRLLVIFCLCCAAYWPALRLPFISDDYSLLPLARESAQHDWAPLWADQVFRTRITGVAIEAGIDRVFGFRPAPFYLASILLHAMCALLIFAMHRWTPLNRETTFWAACFFAVYEGHQEAVMWISAVADILVTLFALLTWLAWTKWLVTRNARAYALALTAFLVALFSKESAWVIPSFLLIPIAFDRRELRAKLIGWLPFLVLALAYIAWIFSWRVAAPGFHDIRFSLSTLFPLVWIHSFWRLLFIWGLAAIGILIWMRERSDGSFALAALLWCGAGLLPYCFLTYMTQVPSRGTYLASVGLALLVGTAASRLASRGRNGALAVFVIAALVVNIEILWIKKIRQFRERAEPSELLRAAAANAAGPVTVNCSPIGQYQSFWVLKDSGATAAFPRPLDEPSDPHCFSVEYRDRAGNVVHFTRRLESAKKHWFS